MADTLAADWYRAMVDLAQCAIGLSDRFWTERDHDVSATLDAIRMLVESEL